MTKIIRNIIKRINFINKKIMEEKMLIQRFENEQRNIYQIIRSVITLNSPK